MGISHISTSSGFFFFCCYWSDFPFPQVELTDICKSELMKRFRLFRKPAAQLMWMRLCEFFHAAVCVKKNEEKESKKKIKRWRNRICFGFLLIFLDDICLVKHTVGWPHRFPEKQNLDIQLWLSAAYQSPSGFEVAAPETFCLLSRVGPRHSNPATLLSCVR